MYLFLYYGGHTSAQAGRIQLNAEKSNSIQAVLPQPLISLTADFSSDIL